jgi:uncharacterized membrane protein
MATNYARLSGTGLDRLTALSDGVFAVAMTLLVLDLRIPVLELVHPEQPFWAGGDESKLLDALAQVTPTLVTYFLSFLTLGIFWVAQQTQLAQLSRVDRDLTWIHLLYLAVVCLMPFTTSLLSEYITFRIPVVIYWLNLLLLGLVLLISLRYTRRAGLFRDDVEPGVFSVQQRRILSFQAAYLVAAALAFVNTYLAIAAIVAVQLLSAVSPFRNGFGRRARG